MKGSEELCKGQNRWDEGLKVFGMKGSEGLQSFAQRRIKIVGMKVESLWDEGFRRAPKLCSKKGQNRWDEGLKVFGMKGSEGLQSFAQRLGKKASSSLG